MVVQVVVAKNLVMMLDLGQSRVVVGEAVRVERYSWTIISGRPLRVYSHTIAHG